MSLIALDASGLQAGLALLDDKGTIERSWTIPLRPGLIETLPPLLDKAAAARGITDIAVCIGPGSFTGLRTSIALAQGFAAGSGACLWGISAWEAYSEALPGLDQPLWVVIRARRGRLFLLRPGGEAAAFADEALPLPDGPIVLAGAEAALIAESLTARGARITLAHPLLPEAAHIGLAALRHKRSGDKPADALPLYVDAPEAKRPGAGLRPFPV